MPDAPPVAEFCAALRQLQLGAGVSSPSLARRLQLSRSQLHAILHGRIKRPPDWSTLVEPFVRACTGDDEQAVAAWRQRHAVLVEVHERLRQQPAPAPELSPPPCLLPPPLADFTGRAGELGTVLRRLSAPGRCVVISGPGGVGKTTLALVASYRLRDRYPDGQLYADFRGTEQRLDPVRAQAAFLRRLGVPADRVPADPGERADLWRTLTADRRLLVVLDNVADEEQVRALLPGPAGGTLVTSRSRLPGLDGAEHLALGLLPRADAIALLGRIVGADRLAAEPGVAERVVEYCGLLPLAVRVAGARLLARPGRPVAHLADQLADERRRFDRLRLGDRDVRVTLALSYRGLAEPVQRAFRLLGLLRGQTFATWTLAALVDAPAEEADELLGELVGAHLVEPAGVDQVGQPRCRMHDLMWLLAAELAGDQDESAAAVRRLGRAWLARIVQAANRAYGPLMLPPEHRDTLPVGTDEAVDADPRAWFAAEQGAFAAAVELLAAAEATTDCWLLVHCAHEILESGSDPAEWERLCRIGLAAATAAGDRIGEGYLLYGLTGIGMRTMTGAAQEYGRKAAAVLSAAGDEWAAAVARANAAEAGAVQSLPGWQAELAAAAEDLRRVGNDADAERLVILADHLGRGSADDPESARPPTPEMVERYERTVRQLRAGGYWLRAAVTGRWLGMAYEDVGDLDRAEATFAEVLAWCERTGDLRGTVRLQVDLSRLLSHRGDLDGSERHVAAAIETGRRAYDEVGRNYALTQLARLRIRQGRDAEALAVLDEAAAALRPLDATRYLDQVESLRARLRTD